MVEQKLEDGIADIERLIEGRATEKAKDMHSKFVEDYKKITVKKATLIEQLEQVKSDINKEYDKSMKFWKDGIDAYFEFMKSHAGPQQLNSPPERPFLPKEFETIGGYINMFKCYIKEEIVLDFDFLKDIFIKSSEGLNSAIGSTAYYANFCSGNLMAISNYSSGIDTPNVNSIAWRK